METVATWPQVFSQAYFVCLPGIQYFKGHYVVLEKKIKLRIIIFEVTMR